MIVVGDHGFVEVAHRALPNDALRAAGLLRLDAPCAAMARLG